MTFSVAAAPARGEILTEAMPAAAQLRDEIVVVKCGGRVVDDDGLRRAFAGDVVSLHEVGIRVVVVHGGGHQISAMLDRLGIASTFAAGLRVTSPEAMDVVRMVLVGQVGRELVGALNQDEPVAVGLSGEDAGLFTAERTAALVDGTAHDIGLVGDVVDVRPGIVLDLLATGRIPVVATVAPDEAGQVHNVNADTAAAALAVALGARKLVVLTDVAGLCRDYPHNDDVIVRIDTAELEAMLPTLSTGMLPKMGACLRAVQQGVGDATVADGRVPHSLLVELLTDRGRGTMVTAHG